MPSPPSRVVVVADAHLGQAAPAVEAAFHAFLDAVPTLGDALLINGDLFDFWFEYSRVIPRRHFATVAHLHDVRRQGIPVTLVGGNHDRWGGEFLTKDLGIAFHAGEAELTVAGRRTFVAHGDGLTADLGFWIADKLSGRLADSTRDAAVLDRAARAQTQYARDLLARRADLDLVVLGHTHRPALQQFANGRVYVNPGAWLDGYRYAVVTSDRIDLRTFTAAAD